MSSDKRFSHVRSSIDTGASLKRFPRSIDKVQKRDEIFQRMKVSTLVTLMLQVAQLELEESILLKSVENEEPDLNEVQKDERTQKLNKDGISTTEYATLQSVIRGVGELDFQDSMKKEKATEILSNRKAVDTNCPYLLLDVRSEEEFKQCHIISAVSYPHTMLSRATNYEIREMSAYKNQPGKMIVLYDSEEVYSTKVASTLVQRGYENIYVLSGGLKTAYRRYPNHLIFGIVPKAIVSPRLTVRSSRAPMSAVSRSSSLPSMNRRPVKVIHTEIAANCETSEKLTQEALLALRNQLEVNLAPEFTKKLYSSETLSSKEKHSSRNSKKNGWQGNF